jgi:predicted cupin superfamily sugar epimerase
MASESLFFSPCHQEVAKAVMRRIYSTVIALVLGKKNRSAFYRVELGCTHITNIHIHAESPFPIHLSSPKELARASQGQGCYEGSPPTPLPAPDDKTPCLISTLKKMGSVIPPAQ